MPMGEVDGRLFLSEAKLVDEVLKGIEEEVARFDEARRRYASTTTLVTLHFGIEDARGFAKIVRRLADG